MEVMEKINTAPCVVEQLLEDSGRQCLTCADNQVLVPSEFVVNRRSASLDPNLVDSFWRLAGVAWMNPSRMAEFKPDPVGLLEPVKFRWNLLDRALPGILSI